MKSFFHRLFFKVVSFTSFQIGKIHAPFSRKLVTAIDYRNLLITGYQDGDILLSRTNGELGNIAIPGEFSHIAIVHRNTVFESVADGVRQIDILDFFMSKDVIVLVRPNFMTSPEIKKMMEYCKAQIGRPYNYDFKFSENDEKFYCTELGYKAITKACPTSPFTLRERLGVLTVSPDDFYKAKKKFIMVWKSKSFK